MGTTAQMLYSAPSSALGIGGGRNDHEMTHDTSPSRPISSPITPSSAALTRYGLMPLDGFQYNTNSPFSTASNTINISHALSSANSGHHSALHGGGGAIHSSVIHENSTNVAKLLAHSAGAGGQNTDNGLHISESQPNDHHNNSTNST